MANVFLSYAREDSARAAIIAKALSRRWTVWWDRTIPPGKTFDDVIEEALDRAACVVVLWSRTSVLSHWVRSEAAEGARRGILVPAILEAAKIPLEFRRVQAANLTAWNGDPEDPEFEQFIYSISTLIEPTTMMAPAITPPRIAEPVFDSFESTPRPEAPEQRQPTRRRSYAVAGVTTLAIVATIGGGVAWWATRVVIMFHLTCLGWLLFRADSFSTAASMLRALASNIHVTPFAISAFAYILFFAGVLFALEWVMDGERKLSRVLQSPRAAQLTVYAYLVFMLIFCHAERAYEFIYFQF